MAGTDRSIVYFWSMLPGWFIAALDAFGLSGGRVAIWDPRWFKLKAYRFFSGILLSGYWRGFRFRINIMNVYAPYSDRLKFWNRLHDCGYFLLSNLIMAGDFNVSFYAYEIWGNYGRSDPLANIIKDLLVGANLMDVPMSVNCPSWVNGRRGNDYIGKRIDHMMICSGLRSLMKGVSANVEDLTLSDHRPISLTWEFEKVQDGCPFKFIRV